MAIAPADRTEHPAEVQRINVLLLVSACGVLIAVAVAWLLWRGDF